MKRIGFLLLGIVVVIVILSLRNVEGFSSHAKKMIFKVAHDIEAVLIEVYHEIQSVSTTFDMIFPKV